MLAVSRNRIDHLQPVSTAVIEQPHKDYVIAFVVDSSYCTTSRADSIGYTVVEEATAEFCCVSRSHSFALDPDVCQGRSE